MLEVVRLINIVLSMLSGLRQPLLNLVLPPLLTVGLLIILYAGWHIRDEGSVAAGLRVAFVDTRANREADEAAFIAAFLQAELREYAKSSKLIDQLLTALLEHAAGSARVRLGIIHNGVTGLTGTSILRYDIINAVAPPGRAAGELVVNMPLSTWSEFLPSLLAGKCQVLIATEVRNFALRERMAKLGATSNLTCPVTDIEGKLLGAIFVDWDMADQPAEGDRLATLTDFDLRIGGQIAAVLNLRLNPIDASVR